MKKRGLDKVSKKKVIAAGHMSGYYTCFSGKELTRVEELLKPGKLIDVKNADVHTGGAVANTGLAMKILGADVSLMGKIGNDPFGQMF